jgi:uncharacterized protein
VPRLDVQAVRHDPNPVSQSGLPPLIRALLYPSVYPHPARNVELVQTHISYVLLAGDYVYKIKKPVDFGFLDYSTLANRRYYCRQEVLLNSRMCSDTYLGVVPIRSQNGRVSFTGRGRVIEYAVKMRRLPEERMMNRLLEKGAIDKGMIRAVAERLAAFRAKAKTSPRSARSGDRALRYAWRENFDQWSTYVGQILTTEQDRILRCFGEAFFARKSAVLKRRVAELRIRECHSDLRSDAVCFTDGVCIFDCVEFSRRIRLVDVARDVGFLAMDLEYRGHKELADAFVDDYVRLSGDEELPQVIGFFKCYNACVRAKVEGLLIGEGEVPIVKRRAARRAAGRYFDLACQYAAQLSPAIVITCGLPGTGKSTVARRLAARTGFTMFSSDVVRKETAGLAPEEHQYETFGEGIYARDYTERTYAELLRQARPVVLEGRSVILDASFIRRSDRKTAARLAMDTGAQFACILLDATPEIVRRRLDRRLARGTGPSDARWQTYIAQKRRFQRPSEIPAELLKVIETIRPRRGIETEILRWLKELFPEAFGDRLLEPSW